MKLFEEMILELANLMYWHQLEGEEQMKLLKCEGAFGVCSCKLEGKPTECEDFFLSNGVCEAKNFSARKCKKLKIEFCIKKGLVSYIGTEGLKYVKQIPSVEAVTLDEMGE
jgi:hypothetical protein